MPAYLCLTRLGEDPALTGQAKSTIEEYIRYARCLASWSGRRAAPRWKWKSVKSPDFLFPVKLPGIRLRMAMEEHVRANRPGLHADIPDFVWRREWVVHVQPAGSGQALLKYLARYVSRSAIAPSAIVSDDERGVTYRFTESDTGLTKHKTLPAEAFILRVLRHALPRGFRRN